MDLENIRECLRDDCYDKLKRLIESLVVDPDLGIPNRRYFEIFGERELKLARYVGKLTVIVADVDRLKEVNDRFGHSVGDEYLKKFVEAVKSSVRETDLFFRWGGDEFVIVLHTDESRAGIVLDRIRERLGEVFLDVGGERIFLSASFGLAEVECDGDWREAFDRAFRLADRRMYEDKNMKKLSGRFHSG